MSIVCASVSGRGVRNAALGLPQASEPNRRVIGGMTRTETAQRTTSGFAEDTFGNVGRDGHTKPLTLVGLYHQHNPKDHGDYVQDAVEGKT